MDKKTWTAEQTAHPHAKADRWALIYDATPGGRDNGDGTRSYALRFPALLLSDLVNDPENVAKEVAAELNSVGPLRAERDAARARAEAAEARVLELEALHAEDMGLCAQMQADEDAARAEVERLMGILRNIVVEYDAPDNGRHLRWAVDEARAELNKKGNK